MSVLPVCKEEEKGREVEPEPDSTPETDLAEINQLVEVSLNSMAGWTSPKTMKLRGTLGEQQVIILIDLGATHNFISTELVNRQHLPLTETKAYGVTMGTGKTVQGSRVC